eukprot:scaffold334176_cov182-Cyclotella_meneghiniana.AAC.1
MDCEGDDATTVKEWQRRRWRVDGRKEQYWRRKDQYRGCGARTSEAAAEAIAGTAAATKANTVASRSVRSKQVCEYALVAIAQLLALVDRRLLAFVDIVCGFVSKMWL